MKHQRQFLTELHKNRVRKLPFIGYFQNDKHLRNELFKQYLETDLKPCRTLYTNQYLSSKEIEKGLKEAHLNMNSDGIVSSYASSNIESRLNEIKTEFQQKVNEDTLDKKYYSHELGEVKIFKKLIIVAQLTEDFKGKVFRKNDVDLIQYANDILTSIIDNLELTGVPELTKLVLNHFINDNDNTELMFAELNDTDLDRLEKDYDELKRYADTKIKEYLEKTKKEDVQDKEPLQIKKLVSLFEHTSRYNSIMDILVSKKYIYENTHIWIDEEKGNKSLLASIIKDMHAKGYFKDKKKPTEVEIKAICQNTFGRDISIDTVKKAKPSIFDLSFIPLASTL